MLTLLLIGGGLASFVAGGVFTGKVALPALHKMPASKVRDALLKGFNGGPGHLPR